MLSREKGACKGFRAALPPAGLAGASRCGQGCGQGLEAFLAGRLIKRGFRLGSRGPAHPCSLPLGPSQLGGVMKGLGPPLPSAHEGVQEDPALLLLLPSPCPPRFPFSEGPEIES